MKSEKSDVFSHVVHGIMGCGPVSLFPYPQCQSAVSGGCGCSMDVLWELSRAGSEGVTLIMRYSDRI